MRNSLNSGMILKGIDSGINNKLRLKKRERVKSGKLGSQVGNSGFLVLCRWAPPQVPVERAWLPLGKHQMIRSMRHTLAG